VVKHVDEDSHQMGLIGDDSDRTKTTTAAGKAKSTTKNNTTNLDVGLCLVDPALDDLPAHNAPTNKLMGMTYDDRGKVINSHT
jgi:hypothetical protein